MDRLIQMIINQVLRQVIRRGVDSGMNHLSRRNTGEPDERPSQDTKDLARKARQAANLARRLGR